MNKKYNIHKKPESPASMGCRAFWFQTTEIILFNNLVIGFRRHKIYKAVNQCEN